MDFIDYGTIKFDIRPAMKRYHKTKTYVRKVCCIDSRVMKRYYEGTITKPDLEILARICFAIGCTLDEVMYYEKPIKIFYTQEVG